MAVLHPGKDPGDGAKVFDPAARTAGSRARTDLEPLDDVDRSGRAEVRNEVRAFIHQGAVGRPPGTCDRRHDLGEFSARASRAAANGARLEHGARRQLEGAEGDSAQAVLGVDDLTLLGETHPTVHDARRLCEDSRPRLAAATARCAAAAVKQGEFDPGPVGDLRQGRLGAVEGPPRRRETGFLARVRVPQHHDLPVAPCFHVGPVEGVVEERCESLTRAFQIGDRFKKRCHVEGDGEVGVNQAGGPRQVQHRQGVVGPLRHGDDVRRRSHFHRRPPEPR